MVLVCPERFIAYARESTSATVGVAAVGARSEPPTASWTCWHIPSSLK